MSRATCKGKPDDDSYDVFTGTYEEVLGNVIRWWLSGGPGATEPQAYDPDDPRIFWCPGWDDCDVITDDEGRFTLIGNQDWGPLVEIDP